jgi:hypothetical protein
MTHTPDDVHTFLYCLRTAAIASFLFRFTFLFIQLFEEATQVNAIHPGDIANFENAHFEGGHGAAQAREPELTQDLHCARPFKEFTKKRIVSHFFRHFFSSIQLCNDIKESWD